jgi:hypothetical protein
MFQPITLRGEPFCDGGELFVLVDLELDTVGPYDFWDTGRTRRCT